MTNPNGCRAARIRSVRCRARASDCACVRMCVCVCVRVCARGCAHAHTNMSRWLCQYLGTCSRHGVRLPSDPPLRASNRRACTTADIDVEDFLEPHRDVVVFLGDTIQRITHDKGYRACWHRVAKNDKVGQPRHARPFLAFFHAPTHACASHIHPRTAHKRTHGSRGCQWCTRSARRKTFSGRGSSRGWSRYQRVGGWPLSRNMLCVVAWNQATPSSTNLNPPPFSPLFFFSLPWASSKPVTSGALWLDARTRNKTALNPPLF